MTSTGAPEESQPQANVVPTRGKRPTVQSQSVPATPRQYAGSDAFISRSPSPGRAPALQSPRSSKAVSASHVPHSVRHNSATCRFMSTQTSRRRIPYTIGTDMLQDAEQSPKVALDPHEERKLSGDMRELYDRLLPTEGSQERRRKVMDKLRQLLEKTWPGCNLGLFMFGSSGNLLCTSKSDGKDA